MFYSRQIGLSNGLAVPILGGARLLGRGGGFQVGALQMRTEDAPIAQAVVTDFSVLRINRDVLKRSRVGVIATRRAPGTTSGVSENYAYGADATFNFLTDLSMTGYWAATETPGRTGPDTSYRGAFNWNADRTGLQVEHLFVGDDFNPEVGLLRRTAFRRSFGQARYSPRPANLPGVRKLFYEASLDYYDDTGGRLQSREAQATFRTEFTTSDQVNLEYTSAFERLSAPFEVTPGLTLPPGDYTFDQVSARMQLSAARKVAGFISFTTGGFYDGTLVEASWQGRVEVSSQLSVEPTLSFNHVETPHGDADTNLIGSRIVYTMTPRMFVGALIQYQSSVKTITSNVRFRWEYLPSSELFIVYSDGRDTNDIGFPPSILNRSVVVKITRLFRL